jgi:hypothetical protein
MDEIMSCRVLEIQILVKPHPVIIVLLLRPYSADEISALAVSSFVAQRQDCDAIFCEAAPSTLGI